MYDGIIAKTMNKVAELIADEVSEFSNRVYAFRPDRETDNTLPAATVDIAGVEIDQDPQQNLHTVVASQNYLVRRFGDMVLTLQISVVAQKKTQAIDLVEQTLNTLLAHLTIEREFGFGRLAQIQETQTGEHLPLLTSINSWAIEYDSMDVDYVVARLTGNVIVPYVVAYERPTLDLNGIINVEQGG